LNGLPARLRRRERVGDDRRQFSVDADEALELRQLTPERHALADLVEDFGLADDGGLRAEQRGERVLLVELACHELADVPPEQVCELVELEAGDRALPRLDLDKGRPGDTEVLRRVLLGHTARFTGCTDPSSELSLSD